MVSRKKRAVLAKARVVSRIARLLGVVANVVGAISSGVTVSEVASPSVASLHE